MANPFPARFDSTCDSCGDPLYTYDDDVFVIDGIFVCEDCARRGNNVCDSCGKYKKSEYDQCYECFMDEVNEF